MEQLPFKEAIKVWIRVAIYSFGGPAGQIAVMHKILVEEKKWISEDRFLHALNYCMLLPGPEAQQLATYIGWLLHRTKGGVTAGILFVIPGRLFCSCTSVGIFLEIATRSNGPLANPPVPMTTSGLNLFTIFLDFEILLINLKGKDKFLRLKERSIPVIHRPSIL